MRGIRGFYNRIARLSPPSSSQFLILLLRPRLRRSPARACARSAFCSNWAHGRRNNLARHLLAAAEPWPIHFVHSLLLAARAHLFPRRPLFADEKQSLRA